MKKLTLRVLCLLVAVVMSFALVYCVDQGDPVETGDGTKAPATNDKDSDTVADTDDGKTSDTETTAPETKEPAKVGATGLEAVKGTVATYIDAGTKDHKNLKLGNVYGIVTNVGGNFKSVNLYTATYDADNGDQITVKVFNWNTDYATTVAGEAVTSVTISGYPNGGWYMVNFEQPLPAGEYVIEISGTSDGDTDHDYGTAIWCMNASPFFMTYENGVEMDDGGVWAQVIVE